MSGGGSKPYRPRAHAREPVKKSKGKVRYQRLARQL
jgi:hypothetical protein